MMTTEEKIKQSIYDLREGLRRTHSMLSSLESFIGELGDSVISTLGRVDGLESQSASLCARVDHLSGESVTVKGIIEAFSSREAINE